jgi:hypothetical protein
MTNPSGYTQSRAGDETLGWNDTQGENAGTVYFTDEERKLLAEIGGKRAGLMSAEVSAWNSVRRPVSVGLVPVDKPGEDPFPLFSDEVEPW